MFFSVLPSKPSNPVRPTTFPSIHHKPSTSSAISIVKPTLPLQSTSKLVFQILINSWKLENFRKNIKSFCLNVISKFITVLVFWKLQVLNFFNESALGLSNQRGPENSFDCKELHLVACPVTSTIVVNLDYSNIEPWSCNILNPDSEQSSEFKHSKLFDTFAKVTRT